MTTAAGQQGHHPIDVAGLAQSLCKDMVRGVFERGGRWFIVTRFSYPGGDSVNLYLTPGPGGVAISDMGTTHYAIRVGGVDLTEEREEFVRRVCSSYGVNYGADRSLSKPLRPGSEGRDVLALCEAITRVSTLAYEAKSRHRSSLDREIDTLISGEVEPKRHVTRDWYNQAIDPAGNHVVSYHFNTVAPPRNMFVVSSRQRADEVVGTIYFLRYHQINDPSLAVVDPAVRLSEKAMKRLREASLVRKGVAGNEQDIVNFALATAELSPI